MTVSLNRLRYAFHDLLNQIPARFHQHLPGDAIEEPPTTPIYPRFTKSLDGTQETAQMWRLLWQTGRSALRRFHTEAFILWIVADFPEARWPRRSIWIKVFVEPEAYDTANGLYSSDLSSFAPPSFFAVKDRIGGPPDIALRCEPDRTPYLRIGVRVYWWNSGSRNSLKVHDGKPLAIFFPWLFNSCGFHFDDDEANSLLRIYGRSRFRRQRLVFGEIEGEEFAVI